MNDEVPTAAAAAPRGASAAPVGAAEAALERRNTRIRLAVVLALLCIHLGVKWTFREASPLLAPRGAAGAGSGDTP